MAGGAGSQFIGIGGLSGAGKTLLADALEQRLGHDNAVIIPLDSYYRPRDELELSERSRLNFDAPDAFDWRLLISHINALASGHPIRRPVYDYTTHTRSSNTVDVDPLRFVVIEGVLALHHPDIREKMHLRVYVECDDDTCLQRRIDRDVRERGRSEESVIRQFNDTVRPMSDRYVRPTRQYADIIIRGDQDVAPSVDVIVEALVAGA